MTVAGTKAFEVSADIAEGAALWLLNEFSPWHLYADIPKILTAESELYEPVAFTHAFCIGRSILKQIKRKRVYRYGDLLVLNLRLRDIRWLSSNLPEFSLPCHGLRRAMAARLQHIVRIVGMRKRARPNLRREELKVRLQQGRAHSLDPENKRRQILRWKAQLRVVEKARALDSSIARLRLKHRAAGGPATIIAE